MTEQKHTPGPWEAIIGHDGRHGCIPILTRAGTFSDAGNWPHHPRIAEAEMGRGSDISRETAEANAKLIAAAPDLLEALSEVMQWVRNWSPDFTQDDEWAATAVKVAHAVTKATA